MSAVAGGWAVERRTVEPAEAHALEVLDEPVRRRVVVFDVASPALVLGSTQPLEVVDAAACRRAGVAVVRRRSGGGAVWVAPGAVAWVDIVVPRGDPTWDDDVGRAAHWVGQRWAAALGVLGVGGAVVHRGGLVRGAWGGAICFAGVGPGEVLVGGRKVVGVSQRRTRSGARFQTMALAAGHQAEVVPLLALDDRPAAAAALAAGVGAVDRPVEAVVDAFVAALASA